MVHGSLRLATRPQRFPRGRLIFSACLAERCGFTAVIASWWEVLKLEENATAGSFGVDEQPRRHLPLLLFNW